MGLLDELFTDPSQLHRDRRHPLERAQNAANMAAVICFGISLILVLWAAYGTFYVFDSRDWPITDGSVLSAEVQTWIEWGPLTVYEARVRYSYTALKTARTNHNRHWGSNYRLRRSWAEEEMAAYPPGTIVTVHYNPDLPEDAVVDTSFNHHIATDIFVALCLLLLTWFLTYLRLAASSKVELKYN